MTPTARETPAGYPRPLLVRADRWQSLDGAWRFEIADEEPAALSKTIRVPYAPETPASGVEAKGFFARCWYERAFDAPALADGERLMLWFEAADFSARVWVNGAFVGAHEGGYTRFGFDVTDALRDGPQTVRVCCDDDPHDLAKPRGKQDWLADSHAIWYPRTTGLWQTVWLERVPRVHVAKLGWTANLATWSIRATAKLNVPADGFRLRVELSHDGKALADDTFSVARGAVDRTIALPDGGIDSIRDDLAWWPHRPRLIDARVTLLDAAGAVVDTVESYTALRTVGTHGERFTLNNRPVELRLVLDQGYWPDTGLTPPDDAAIVRDIELTQALGFNGVRKHQKIEAERFLYFADRAGLLVWEEMPSAYAFAPEAQRLVSRQWQDAIERDASHPCVIAWVPVNESWAVPDLNLSAAQRHFVESLYFMTKALDPTRPVVSNDGWEMTRTDLLNVHDYDYDPERLKKRYDRALRDPATIWKQERPGNRALVLGDDVYVGQPALLTEFGGIALSADESATWGYSRATSGPDLAQRYARLLTAVRAIDLFKSGFCYTQLTDTYQEANGLLTMAREPKAPLEGFAVATRGPRNPEEQAVLDKLTKGA